MEQHRIKTLIDIFREDIEKSGEQTDKCHEKLSKFLADSCKILFKNEENPPDIVVYWSSIFRNKGIRRAVSLVGGRVASQRKGDNDLKLMNHLMVIDSETPYHLLVFAGTRKGKGKSGNKQPPIYVYFDNKERSPTTPEGSLTIQIPAPGEQFSVWWKALGKLARDIVKKNGISIDEAKKLFNEKPKSLKWTWCCGESKKLPWNQLILLTHPILRNYNQRKKSWKYGLLIYQPVYVNGVSLAGVVLGYKVLPNNFKSEEFCRSFCEKFLYPVHSAESRATPIIKKDYGLTRYPVDAFKEKCEWTISGKKKHGFCEIITALKGNPTLKSKECNVFLEGVSSRFADRNLYMWDAAEAILWSLYDALHECYGLTERAVDLRNDPDELRTLLKSKPVNPLLLLVSALHNERELGRLSDYREHFVHSFHVFLLGLCALTNMGNVKVKKADIVIWMHTAFFHDIGYAVEKIVELSNDFIHSLVPPHYPAEKTTDERVKNAEEIAFRLDIPMNPHWGTMLVPSDFNIAYEKLIRGISDLFGWKADAIEKQGAVRSWLSHVLMSRADHGIISALLLLISSEKGKSHAPILEKAATAIALHNFCKWGIAKKGDLIDKGIPADIQKDMWTCKKWLTKNKSALLLMLCDETQEFGREKEGVCKAKNNKFCSNFGSAKWKFESQNTRGPKGKDDGCFEEFINKFKDQKIKFSKKK
jgi:hypothetical protein